MPKARDNLTFGSSSNEWAIVDRIVIQPLKSLGSHIWVFGSRARGDYRQFSDLDILYSCPQPVMGLIPQMKLELEESDLSVKVDLVYELDLVNSYRENVLLNRIEV